MKSKFRQQRGASLAAAIMFMGVIALFVGAYWSHLHRTLAFARASAKAAAARALADAGVERCLAEFRAGHTDFTSAGPEPLHGGVYRVSVASAENGARLITAVGALGDAQESTSPQTVRVKVWLSADGVPGRVQYLPEAR